MQDLFPLVVAALFVYLIFFRRGGMGMGCCGGHGDHGDHSGHDDHDRNNIYGSRNAEHVKSMHYAELFGDSKEDVIELGKDQYTVLTVTENKQPEAADRTISQKTN